uniref:Uncharacterized protein n=1 Tax=Glossina pallidipes TaxID=7398 RepID=A0A1B0AB68_GLOPL
MVARFRQHSGQDKKELRSTLSIISYIRTSALLYSGGVLCTVAVRIQTKLRGEFIRKDKPMIWFLLLRPIKNIRSLRKLRCPICLLSNSYQSASQVQKLIQDDLGYKADW